MNLNTVILGGNLTSDPASPGTGISLCTFTLSFEGPFGSDRGGGDRRRDFVAVVAFGKSAEACLAYLKKGSRIVVDGRLRQDRWQSAVSGQHSRMTVVADRVHFVSGLRKATRAETGQSPGTPAQPAAAELPTS
jgi:single-strand DNA-binding protein